MSEPCVCTHGPYAHHAEDGDCTWTDCWCTSYQPESTVHRAEMPDTDMYRRMRAGHKIRHGHDLIAHLEDDDNDGIYQIVRECCEED